jgi:hypothetical protein
MAYKQFVIELDEDTRILVKLDPEDDQTPIELYNDDDLTRMQTPPEGSALREKIADEILQWYVRYKFEPPQPTKPTLVQ